jgi:tetratricopeptide (TPR) repeat protein
MTWCELAKEYFKFGYFNYAKDYSLETRFHALVLKDKDIFIDTNLLLANIHFVESDFDSSSKLFLKIQNFNQDPNIFFKVIQYMVNIFDYMGKYEEMIHYLESLLNYLENVYNSEIKSNTYKSSVTIFYQVYTYTIINVIRAYIKKYSENIRINEYNIIKQQKLNVNATLRK